MKTTIKPITRRSYRTYFAIMRERGLNCFVWRCSLLLALLLSTMVAASQPNRSEYFKITVIDAATGRGVPLVEFKTTNEITVYTDSNGIVAWNEPGLMDRDIYFSIRSHGYFFPRQGRKLRTTRGASVVLKIERVNIAERLYRITGQGIYRDSILTGTPVPLRHPVLNGEVMGQDTVFATPYRGKLFWLWDDTGRAAGPLGSLAGCAATSELPGKGGLDPSVGVDLNYFLDDAGFCKQITPFPIPGMQWKSWATTVMDEQGRERFVSRYQSMKGLGDPYEIGLAVFNDEKEVFERYVSFGRDAQSTASIHPFLASSRGSQLLYFPGPLPDLRAPAELKALGDPATYEGFSCLTAGSRYAKEESRLDRAPDGKLLYAWKRNTPPLTFDQEKELVEAGKMKLEEALYQLRDILTGAPVKPHAGSVYWNDYRGCWIMIVQEDHGLADNGEIWYAEGDTPVGPWVYARKVVTHNKYTFYNPTQHPFFDQEGGRLIYFEGTFSDTFSGSLAKTPRYDYNQIMYRLALDDSRLFLPAPVYRLKNGQYMFRREVASRGAWGDVEEIPFFALPPERHGKETIQVGNLFSALPATSVERSETLAGRWNCREGGGSEFPLTLWRSGDIVSGTLDGDNIKKVTFKDNKLAFEVDIADQNFQVSVEPKGGKLTGRWKEGQEGDTVDCEREETADWTKSPDVVRLYTYRRADGTVIYSTEAVLRDARLKRLDTPVGRVWRNPMRVLALDPEAAAK